MGQAHHDRWVCIVGGGKSQLPFVRAAAAHKLKTLVFDLDPDAPAKAVADRFFPVSTHDKEQIFAICDGLAQHLVGCFTYSSHEKALDTTASVVERYGLRGLTRASLQATASKSVMRQLLKRADIAVPEHARISTLDQAHEFLQVHPVAILKPGKGSCGSAGVSILSPETPNQAELLEFTCGLSSDGQAIIEAFIDGTEYSVDGFVDDSKVHILALSRKHSKGRGHGFLIDGYTTDMAGLSGEAPNLPGSKVLSLTERAIRALHIDDCFFSLDILSNERQLFVLDAGLLLDAKIDRLLRLAEIDIYRIPFECITGRWSQRPSATTTGFGACGLKFVYPSKPGVLTRAIPREADGTHAFALELERGEGDTVGEPASVADIIGWACASGVSVAEVWQKLNQLDLSPYITVEPDA